MAFYELVQHMDTCSPFQQIPSREPVQSHVQILLRRVVRGLDHPGHPLCDTRFQKE